MNFFQTLLTDFWEFTTLEAPSIPLTWMGNAQTIRSAKKGAANRHEKIPEGAISSFVAIAIELNII